MLEQLLNQVDEPPFVPPPVLDNTVFKGFVNSDDLIDGRQLASLVGLTDGTAVNTDAGWLHFKDGDFEFYVARKAIRAGMTGASLTAASQKNGKRVKIGDRQYNVRMMSGMANDFFSSIISVPGGGEWDKYMYPIYGGPKRPIATQWSSYNLRDLGLPTGTRPTTGSISLCRDQHATIANAYAGRGWNYSGYTPDYSPIALRTVINDGNPAEGNAGVGRTAYGWRPLLELLPATPVVSDSGPGPADMIEYDPTTDTGYFGDLPNNEFFSTSAIEARGLVPLTGDEVFRLTESLWNKFYYKGKVLMIPKRVQRRNGSWSNLYLAGFVYGTNNTGIAPGQNAPTNQLRTIDWTSGDGTIFRYAIRLPKGFTIDLPDVGSVTGGPNGPTDNTAGSEISCTVERITPQVSIDTVWGTQGGPQGTVALQESWNYAESGSRNYAYIANVNTNAWSRGRFLKTQRTGWLPVLELIEVIKP